MPLMRYVH